MRILHAVIFVAVALTACATMPKRDASGRVELDGNRLTHRSGEPFYCFAYTGNGQERHECAVSNDLCQARITARTAEKFEMASACKESEGVYCFGWVEGETSNSQCYETEPDCTELSAEISARVGKENASACQHFDRTHQTY